MAVTILQLATYRLGRQASSSADFEEAELQMIGGCSGCHATIGAFNAYPSMQNGYWQCKDCIEQSGDGWEDVAEAAKEIFGE